MARVVVSQERRKGQEVDNETRERGLRQEEVKVKDQKEGEGAQAAPSMPAATMELSYKHKRSHREQRMVSSPCGNKSMRFGVISRWAFRDC